MKWQSGWDGKIYNLFYSVIETKAALGHGLLFFLFFILRFLGARGRESLDPWNQIQNQHQRHQKLKRNSNQLRHVINSWWTHHCTHLIFNLKLYLFPNRYCKPYFFLNTVKISSLLAYVYENPVKRGGSLSLLSEFSFKKHPLKGGILSIGNLPVNRYYAADYSGLKRQ
jgi:hypothetical protein